MAKPIITLRKVWKTYYLGDSAIHALSGLDVTIHEKQFVVIMGPSGSGKSTAMNMVGCLDVPTKGTIILDGQDISLLYESDLAQIRGQKIGFIFQKFNLIPTLSAVENVALPMMFQSVMREDRITRATELLQLVGLGDRLYHKPNELSGGQQQRVAIARSLANDPPIILADEPTGNLDSKTGEAILALLEKLHREQGKTIILVTHDPRLVEFADVVYHLLDGKLERSQQRRKKRT